jgi:autotransporter-associated beta strand protein
MAALFSKCLVNQFPFTIKRFKRRPGLALFCSIKTTICLAICYLVAIVGLALPAAPALAANTVNINDTRSSAVYGNSNDGGNTANLPPNDNQLNINPGANVSRAAYGALSFTAPTANNTVNISGGTVREGVSGGSSQNGSATGNRVNISDGTVSGGISGGSTLNGNATGNIVTISGGTINGNVYGGFGGTSVGTATNNTVTVSGNPTFGATTRFYGGDRSDDFFSGNTLVKNSDAHIYWVQNFEYIKFGDIGNANIDRLNVWDPGTDGERAVKLDTQGHNITFGGEIFSPGSIEKQGAGTLTLSGANTYTGSTTVSAGTLEVTGSLAGGSYAGAITNNAALVFNQAGAQTLSGVVSGSGSLTKNGAGTLTLTNNNTYTGLTVVRGGTLALTGTGRLGDNGSGGLSLFSGTNFDFSGLSAASLSLPRLTVNGLGAAINATGKTADFTNGSLFFNIPDTAVADSVILALQGSAQIDGSTAVGLDTPSGRPNLNKGEKLILLDATALDATGFNELTVQTKSGDIYYILVNGDQLLMVLEHISPTGPSYERLKAFVESRAATLAFVDQGHDLIINRGFGSALAATAGPGVRSNAFGGLGGGWSRYETGSQVDLAGLSLLAGLALGNDIPYGRLTLGAFYEGGLGDYSSHNSFINAASVGGQGDTKYFGYGLLGRYDLKESPLSGLYAEASARTGWTRTDFNTSDIQYNGWNASFESSALYYGLHGGLGYVRNLTDKASLDLSAKLLWTRLEGDSLTVYQDRLVFEDADSARTRLGGRYGYAVNEYMTPYGGAYWEREFEGELRASVNGQRLSSPSLKGDTGTGEFGVAFKPSKNLPLSLDLGVQGYVGKREGVAQSLLIRYEF